jgi:2-iminobutanoate/2-iminopropanoate deaminase
VGNGSAWFWGAKPNLLHFAANIFGPGLAWLAPTLSFGIMKTIVYASAAPEPIGPYSQAIVANGFIFLSGQIALDQSTGSVIAGDIEAETHQVMRNLQSVLAAAGSSLDKVLKCSIFVRDLSNFGRINTVYAGYFTDGVPPARETVEVSRLPKDVNVEISCIALA